MSNNKTGNQQGSSHRIEPASINLSHIRGDVDTPPRTGTSVKRFSVILMLGILLLIAGGVIFILPDWTPRPDTHSTAVIPKGTSTVAVTTTPAKPAASPWTEAQMAKIRKETQDLLADMLKIQEELEEKNVTGWAEQDYQQAIKSAEDGDAAYRERDLDAALNHYHEALEQFRRLQERSATQFNQSLEAGMQALQLGDAATAKQAFQTAQLIEPENGDALKGMQRAETLEEVFQLIETGDDHIQAGTLDEARKIFQQALALDPETRLAREKLEQVNDSIRERDFKRAMTEGYAALENNRLQNARDAFLQARKIKPDASEVKTALDQVTNRITSGKIAEFLQQARTQEQNEEWRQAVLAYDQALALDVSLIQAHQGREKAQWRSNLDARLNMAISKPERLSTKAVYDEALVLLRDASRIENPGTRLKRQIAVLEVLLQEAASPVQVILQSDNETEITLYKNGELGRFLQKEMSLLPGQYVAVGYREGYRDVRVEFLVEANKQMQPVIIQCEEKVSSRN